MWPPEATEMSAELRDELAAGNTHRIIDPRTMPVRFSWLKQFARSPAHAFHAVQHMNNWPQSTSLRIGSGAHAMLFGTPVKQFGGKVRRGKEWDAFRAENPTAALLSAKEWSAASAIADAVKRNEMASRVMLSSNTVHEKKIAWKWNDRECQSTPDALSAYTLVDFKTTKCADPNRFVRDAMYMGYHAQLAFYSMAVRETRGIAPRDCYIVAVENKAPHPVVVLKLTERALDMGARLVRGWMERLKVCEDSNEWPGYVQCVTDFDVPDDDLGLTFGDDDDAEDAT